MRFEQWKKELLGLNEYEKAEQQRVLDETLPKRRELLAMVQRTWLCRATGAKVTLNSYGMIEGDKGPPNVWLRRTSNEIPLSDVSRMEPEELELLAKVKRAAQAWLNGETDEIVVDGMEALPVEPSGG